MRQLVWGWLALLSVIVSGPAFSQPSWQTLKTCLVELQQWIPITQAPQNRLFDGALYQKELESDASLTERSDPESLIAWADAQIESPIGKFYHHIQTIHSEKGNVWCHSYRFPYGLAAKRKVDNQNAPPRNTKARYEQKRRYQFGWPLIERQRNLHLSDSFRPSTDEEQGLIRLYDMALGLAIFRLESLQQKIPITSPPIGSSSYPSQVIDTLLEVEALLYSVQYLAEQKLGRLTQELPSTDKVWKWKALNYSLTGLMQFFFPLPYRVVKPFRANQQAYELFKKDLNEGHTDFPSLRDRLKGAYQTRARLRWTISRYRLLVLGLALYMASDNALSLVDYVQSGEWRSVTAKFQNAVEAMRPQNANRHLEKYESNPDIDPIVRKHYEGKIQRIEEKIKSEGDPVGALRARIDELKRRMEGVGH